VRGLTPNKRPAGRAQNVSIRDVQPSRIKPAAALVHEVKKFGLLVPPVLGDTGDRGYRVIEGEHRVEAARAARIKIIPANVLDWDDVADYADQLGISLNRTKRRREDEAKVFRVVRDLKTQGHSQRDIAHVLNLDSRTVRTMVKLTSLQGTFIDEWIKGNMSYSVVRLVAKYTLKTQRDLAYELNTCNRGMFGKSYRITEKWVREALVVVAGNRGGRL